MYFMKYKGGADEGDFIEEKIYAARDVLEVDAVGRKKFYVLDENQDRQKFEFEGECFREYEMVYAAWLGTIPCNYETGQVVVIDRATETQYGILDGGYYNHECFEIIDGTNLRTGILVCDIETGRWVKVSRTDDKFNISSEENPDDYHTLTDFRLAIGDGSVMDFPLAYCVNNTGANLTLSKGYPLVASEGDLVCVADDSGVVGEFDVKRFVWFEPNESNDSDQSNVAKKT